MNRTQRVIIKSLRNLQNEAKARKNAEISGYGRSQLKCKVVAEEEVRKIIIAKKNNYRKEVITA